MLSLLLLCLGYYLRNLTLLTSITVLRLVLEVYVLVLMIWRMYSVALL